MNYTPHRRVPRAVSRERVPSASGLRRKFRPELFLEWTFTFQNCARSRAHKQARGVHKKTDRFLVRQGAAKKTKSSTAAVPPQNPRRLAWRHQNQCPELEHRNAARSPRAAYAARQLHWFAAVPSCQNPPGFRDHATPDFHVSHQQGATDCLASHTHCLKFTPNRKEGDQTLRALAFRGGMRTCCRSPYALSRKLMWWPLITFVQHKNPTPPKRSPAMTTTPR